MQQFWLAFGYVHGIGSTRIRQLYDHFGSLETAWLADLNTLRQMGLPENTVNHLGILRRELNPDALLERVEQFGAWVLTLADETYPNLLREIHQPPAVIYGRGTLLPQDELAIAVIGTRRASSYGKAITQRLVAELVANGVTIVSGLAHGIDAHAHQAALEAGGRTIAVMGTGIDAIYPTDHRRLADQIVESGAVITLFPPDTKPERHNFPVRNRMISGMSLGTVIIEAPESSGALNTASAAGAQGRDVFAVPGNITSPNSAGCNRLIQDGAKLVMDARDILNELNLAHHTRETRKTVTEIVPATPLEADILQHLQTEALHVDDISRRCGLSIKDVNATIALMELKGLVIQISPMTYQVF